MKAALSSKANPNAHATRVTQFNQINAPLLTSVTVSNANQMPVAITSEVMLSASVIEDMKRRVHGVNSSIVAPMSDVVPMPVALLDLAFVTMDSKAMQSPAVLKRTLAQLLDARVSRNASLRRVTLFVNAMLVTKRNWDQPPVPRSTPARTLLALTTTLSALSRLAKVFVHAKMDMHERTDPTDVNLSMHVTKRDVHTMHPALSSRVKQHVHAWKDSKEIPKEDVPQSGRVTRRVALLMHHAMSETARLNADATLDIGATQTSNALKSIPARQPDAVPMQSASLSTTLANADAKKDISETEPTAEHTVLNVIVSERVFQLSSTAIVTKIVRNRVRVTTEPTLALIMLWECAQVAATAILLTVPRMTSAS